MQATQFSLQGVWRLRKAERDQCRLALAAALAQQTACETALARLTDEFSAVQQRRHAAAQAGAVRLLEIQDGLRLEESLRQERLHWQRQASEAADDVAQRQDDLRRAESDWRAIEWLRERRTGAADCPDFAVPSAPPLFPAD